MGNGTQAGLLKRFQTPDAGEDLLHLADRFGPVTNMDAGPNTAAGQRRVFVVAERRLMDFYGWRGGILPAMRPAGTRVAVRARFRHPVPETKPAATSSVVAGVVADTLRGGFVAALTNVLGVARIPPEAAPGTSFGYWCGCLSSFCPSRRRLTRFLFFAGSEPSGSAKAGLVP